MKLKIASYDNHLIFTERLNEVFDIETFKEIINAGELDQDIVYEENIWLLRKKVGMRRVVFPYELNPIYNDYLKCFAIIQLKNSKNIDYIVRRINIVSEIIHETNFFNLEFLHSFEDFLLLEVTDSQKNKYFNALKDFYSLTNIENVEKFLSEVEGKIPSWNSNTKKLPPFSDILILERYINDFFNVETLNNEHIKFFPILLWWKLTMLIPMRTEEFCSLKKSDFKKENGKYILTINRIKQNDFSAGNVNPLVDFELPIEMAQLMNLYIHISDGIKEDEMLFPIHMWSYFLKTHGKKLFEKKDSNVKYIIPRDMNRLLDKFYEEIVTEKDVEQLSINDTRHLSISNLRLQGFNPYTIARMAGHQSLETQNHYSNHIETFLESKIVLMVEELSRDKNYKSQFVTAEDIKRLSIVQKNLTESVLVRKENLSLKPIDNGFCSDENFPSNCIQNCILCPFFRFGKNTEEIKATLLSTARDLNKEYVLELKAFNSFFVNSLNTISKEEYNVELNEKIKSSTYRLNKLVSQIVGNKVKILEVEGGI